MTQPRETENQTGAQTTEGVTPRPITQAEFYLAMKERPDPSGLGLHPDFRHFFVGQEAAYSALRSAISNAPPRSIIAIPAPFGAGKNALLGVVVRDMIADGQLEEGSIRTAHVEIDLGEEKSWEETIRATKWASPEKQPQGRKVRALYIDEVSYSWQRTTEEKGEFIEKLSIASKFLGNEAEIFILLGDDALRDPEIVGALGSPYDPIYIELERLTPEMLLKTLRIRIADALERSAEAVDVDNLIDPEFMRALVPNADYPLADMRGVLSELQYLGINLKPLAVPVHITPELVRGVYGDNWYEDFRRSKNSQDQDFRIWFRDYLRGLLREGEQIRAMTLEEMIRASGLNIDPSKYKKLYSFLRDNVLLTVDHSKGLYLPRSKFLLEVSVMDLPLDPATELGQKEVKRIQDMFYGYIKFWSAGAKGLEPLGDMIFGVSRAYGWDKNFVISLFKEFLDGFENRKAREEQKQREEMEEL